MTRCIRCWSGPVVAVLVCLLSLSDAPRLEGATGDGPLPSLTAAELARAVRAQEQAIRTLRIKGTRLRLRPGVWDESWLEHPERAPFQEGLESEIEWAFEGSPDRGKVISRDKGREPHYDRNVRKPGVKTPKGEYAFTGYCPYGEWAQGFNGEYQVSLDAAGVFEDSEAVKRGIVTPETISGGIAHIRAERPQAEEKEISLYEFQAHTLWFNWDPLSQLIEDGRAEIVGHEEVDGRPTYRVEATFPERGLVYRLWLDPERGFSIVRQQRVDLYGNVKGKVWEETLMVEVQQQAPGVWLPAEILVASPRTEGLWRFTIDEVSVNKPLDPEVFEVEIPPRVQVIDERHGVSYTVGQSEDGLDELTHEASADLTEEIAKLSSTPEAEGTGSKADKTARTPAPTAQATATAAPSGGAPLCLLVVAGGAALVLTAIMALRRLRKARS